MRALMEVLQGERQKSLRTEISHLRQTVDYLARKVERHDELFEALFGAQLSSSASPIDTWLHSHQEDLQRYKGLHVAFENGRGIVAEGKTVNEVLQKAQQLGILNQIELGF